MYTIQELRALHKLSKPEFNKVIENTNAILNSEIMSKKTRAVLTGLITACHSYNEVIDTLFEEIDRLNGMK